MKKQVVSPRSRTKKQAAHEESELWQWASEHHKKALQRAISHDQKIETVTLQQMLPQRIMAFLKIVLPIFKKRES